MSHKVEKTSTVKRVTRKPIGPVTPTPVAEHALVPIKKLKSAPYNPRKLNEEQLNSLCASIVKFGLVEDVVVRKEDMVVIGGHQRIAAVHHLLAGKYVVGGEVVPYDLPESKMPCVLVSGLSERDAKMLNLALNKISGEWDYNLLPSLLSTLNAEVSLSELMVTGFTASEITDYLDVYKDFDTGLAEGTVPEPITRSPKLVVDFATTQQRDAFKTYLGTLEKKNSNEPVGCALLRTLKL